MPCAWQKANVDFELFVHSVVPRCMRYCHCTVTKIELNIVTECAGRRTEGRTATLHDRQDGARQGPYSAFVVTVECRVGTLSAMTPTDCSVMYDRPTQGRETGRPGSGRAVDGPTNMGSCVQLWDDVSDFFRLYSVCVVSTVSIVSLRRAANVRALQICPRRLMVSYACDSDCCTLHCCVFLGSFSACLRTWSIKLDRSQVAENVKNFWLIAGYWSVTNPLSTLCTWSIIIRRIARCAGHESRSVHVLLYALYTEYGPQITGWTAPPCSPG